jgi:hypothetical protein
VSKDIKLDQNLGTSPCSKLIKPSAYSRQKKSPKGNLRSKEKTPRLSAQLKKNPQAGKTIQKLYLNQNPFDVNSTDPDALRKKILTTRRERRRHKPLLHESGRMDCSREGDQKRK